MTTGRELGDITEELDLAAPGGGPGKGPHPVKVLCEQAHVWFRLVHCDGRAYAVAKPGLPNAPTPNPYGTPGVAIPLGAPMRRALVKLAKAYNRKVLADPDGAKPLAPVSRTTADTVLLELEASAFDGPETPLHLRFAHDPDAGRVVLDLGHDDGRVVVITADGWESSTSAPYGVYFRRTPKVGRLPVPERGGRLDELAGLLALDAEHLPAHRPPDDPRCPGCRDDRTFRALLGWVVALPFPASVRPGVLLTGPPGSGKSTRLRLAASVVEPSGPDALGSAFGRNQDHDDVRALHRAVPLWDNLTGVSQAVSDALCCYITGTAREGRQLYSDDTLSASPVIRRPVGLTAVSTPAGLRADALDRLIICEMATPAVRLDDAEVQRRFDAAHPRLLGAVCDAVSAILRRLGNIPQSSYANHRMAAHAHVLAALDAAVADGDVTGCPVGLLDAYAATMRETAERTAADDVFGGALLAMLDAMPVVELDGVKVRQWQGTATALLADNRLTMHRHDWTAAGWPKSARALPNVLNQLIGPLRTHGVGVDKRTKDGRTVYTFMKASA